VQDRQRGAIQACQLTDYGERPNLIPWLVGGQWFLPIIDRPYLDPELWNRKSDRRKKVKSWDGAND
jgi:hypothetical protein